MLIPRALLLQCDGSAPCQRCVRAGDACVFATSDKKIKHKPRQNGDKPARSKNDASLASQHAHPKADADAHDKKPVIIGQIRRLSTQESSDSSPGNFGPAPLHPSYPSSVTFTDGEGSLRHNSIQEPPGSSLFSDSGISTSWEPSLTSQSSPEHAEIRIDAWTRTGWTTRHVQQKLESILADDYLPSCLLCRGPFLQGFASGDSSFCSSALVNALLALSMCDRVDSQGQYNTQKGNENRSEDGAGSGQFVLHDGNSPCEQLFSDARHMVTENTNVLTLPDIQALGVLAMFQLVSSRESEARELAGFFGDAMTNLCLRETHTPAKEPYRLVRATSYCAAISLIRFVDSEKN